MPKSKTNKLTQKILDHLLRIPHTFAWRQNSTGLYDPKLRLYRPAPKRGVSDIICISKGSLIAIEIKTGNDKLRPEQESFKLNIENAKGHYMEISSFEEFVKEYDIIMSNETETETRPRS